MSVVAIRVSNRFWGGVLESPVGASSASQHLGQLFEKAEKELAIAAGADVTDSLNELFAVFKECSARNWDGYGARPVSSAAVLEALSFIEQIPADVESPDVLPEPDGSIGLDWSDERGRTMVVSFSGTSQLAFAALLGGGTRIHGSVRFVGSIPSSIRDTLMQCFRRSTPKTRAN